MDKIPILEFQKILVVSLQSDIYDTMANQLQDDIGERLSTSDARGVLIDISALDIVDTYIGRILGVISEISKIMGAETVVVGMQPSVAITLVELGMELKEIKTAVNMDQGMKILSEYVNHSDHDIIEEGEEIIEGEEYNGIS